MRPAAAVLSVALRVLSTMSRRTTVITALLLGTSAVTVHAPVALAGAASTAALAAQAASARASTPTAVPSRPARAAAAHGRSTRKAWSVVARFDPDLETEVAGGYGWGAWLLSPGFGGPHRIVTVSPRGHVRTVVIERKKLVRSLSVVRVAESGGGPGRAFVTAAFCHRDGTSCRTRAIDLRAGARRTVSWLPGAVSDEAAGLPEARTVEDRVGVEIRPAASAPGQAFPACQATVVSLDEGTPARALPVLPDCKSPRDLRLRDGLLVFQTERASLEGDRSHGYVTYAIDLRMPNPAWTVVGQLRTGPCGTTGVSHAEVSGGDVVTLSRNDVAADGGCDSGPVSSRAAFQRWGRALLGATAAAPVPATRAPFQGIDAFASLGSHLLAAKVFSTGSGARQRFHGEIRRFSAR